MIDKSIFVSDADCEVFFEKLTQSIDKMQKEGLTVEVHYQTAAMDRYYCIYSALLLGRVKGE